MPLRLLRINYAALRYPGQEPLAEPGHWRLYAPCTQADANTCQLLHNIAFMQDGRDRKAALAALHKLIQVAASGKPLQVFYDEKQCHDIHRFRYDGQERVLWRIRHNAIRIVFYYGKGRLILLADALVKRKDTLSPAEKSALERQVATFLDAEKASQLEPFELQAPPAHPGASP